jgi:hypothetical protein
MIWRYKTVSPWKICLITAMKLAQPHAYADKERFRTVHYT